MDDMYTIIFRQFSFLTEGLVNLHYKTHFSERFLSEEDFTFIY